MNIKRPLALALACCTAVLASRAGADEVLVSAASSLTDAFTEIGKAYTKAYPQTVVRFNFGASGALYQQILQGAPVDVFASASPKEMDALFRVNRIQPGQRADFAGNRLVLIAPAQSPLKRWEDLKAASVRRVAVSNPDSVPSGRYAKETLTKRDLWSAVQPKIVFGENVRQTLAYVAGGNVDAGIVFASDAQIEKRRIRIVEAALPGRDHAPIVYPAAVITRAPNGPAALSFIRFLQSRAAQSILTRYGFLGASSVPDTAAPARPAPTSRSGTRRGSSGPS